MADMDKVVQQNASSAEESASASEEMSAQAETMKGMVDDLVVVVGKSGKGERREDRSTDIPAKTTRATEVKPGQVIPLEDKDFQNF